MSTPTVAYEAWAHFAVSSNSDLLFYPLPCSMVLVWREDCSLLSYQATTQTNLGAGNEKHTDVKMITRQSDTPNHFKLKFEWICNQCKLNGGLESDGCTSRVCKSTAETFFLLSRETRGKQWQWGYFQISAPAASSSSSSSWGGKHMRL